MIIQKSIVINFLNISNVIVSFSYYVSPMACWIADIKVLKLLTFGRFRL